MSAQLSQYYIKRGFTVLLLGSLVVSFFSLFLSWQPDLWPNTQCLDILFLRIDNRSILCLKLLINLFTKLRTINHKGVNDNHDHLHYIGGFGIYMYNSFQLVSDINECASHLCENSATCVDQVNSYKCQCVAGYTGVYCETSKYGISLF